ncbi:MAG: hypothetical protein R3F56_08085 [Planctomycetota bacterium]
MSKSFEGANRARDEGGFTFAELAFGLLIFVIISVVLANHLSVNYATTRGQRDSVFAYGKAQSILAEIQSYVDRGAVQAAIDLDALDDGVVNKPQLTITTQAGALVPPDHPISGNFQRGADWTWSRRITVQRFPGLNNRNVRFVTVQVFKRDMAGLEHPLASISSVVNSIGSAFPTTQVYDLYLLAIENIPGWWVFMESIVPFVESAITDLEARNPGLAIRTHWITKASYGRSQLYRPYVNLAVDSTVDIPQVYYYPGKMPAGSASQFYYVPTSMRGHMSIDGTEANGYSTSNPMPYSYADWFNNAARLPQERQFHQDRVDLIRAKREAIETAKRLGTPPPAAYDDMSEEPTLRLLLEDMCSQPDLYRNAWVINLHGELLPMPALRNYSDAAKAPDRLPNVRVVAHPEELRTRRTSGTVDDVNLRVYSYTTDLQYVSNRSLYLLNPLKPKVMPANMPICIEVPGIDLTDGSDDTLHSGVRIQGITGGVTRSGATVPYSTGFFDMPVRSAVGDPANEMFFEITFDTARTCTVIKLYNSPVVSPWVEGPTVGQWRGVSDQRRTKLYGFDYVPSSPGSTTDFSRTLATIGGSGDSVPRNTARWRITIPGNVFGDSRFVDSDGNYINPGADQMMTFRTRIWDATLGFGTGQAFPTAVEPDNLSETYTWWADSREDVPVTERSQFLGDPRLNPYKDLLHGDPDFPDGYNWFHDGLNNSGENAVGDFAGLDAGRLRNGWRYRIRADVPRFFQLLRTGLVNCSAVYTTLTGFSYYYMGLGNEIGSDSANGYPNSIPTSLMPWGSGSGAWGYMNTITWYRSLPRDMNWFTPSWNGQPWLGELYPDSASAAWLAAGNLPATAFFQYHDQVVYQNGVCQAYGVLMQPQRQICAEEGCTSFFNIGTSSSTFHHHFWDGTSTLVGAGLDIGSRFNFPMPASAPSNRPFRIDTNFHGTVGEEWSYDPYQGSGRFSARLAKVYYNHPASGGTGSGLVELRNPGNTRSAYVAVNGISNAVASGSSFIAKYSVLTMVQSFLEGADPTMSHGMTQLPRVEIESPTEITELVNPSAIQIRYGVTWRRWDGQTYTSSTPLTFSQPESDLDYVVMYSRDNGATWLICGNDHVATPGVRPTNPLDIVMDGGTGTETFGWPVPVASFPQGTYVVRVECYRRGLSLHYAQHQVRIFINR